MTFVPKNKDNLLHNHCIIIKSWKFNIVDAVMLTSQQLKYCFLVEHVDSLESEH